MTFYNYLLKKYSDIVDQLDLTAPELYACWLSLTYGKLQDGACLEGCKLMYDPELGHNRFWK